MCQHIHVQNHAYINKSSRAYVRDVHQMLNPALAEFCWFTIHDPTIHNPKIHDSCINYTYKSYFSLDAITVKNRLAEGYSPHRIGKLKYFTE